mgnify:CR=1 FL=1
MLHTEERRIHMERTAFARYGARESRRQSDLPAANPHNATTPLHPYIEVVCIERAAAARRSWQGEYLPVCTGAACTISQMHTKSKQSVRRSKRWAERSRDKPSTSKLYKQNMGGNR